MKTLTTGCAASAGIALGKAYVVARPDLTACRAPIPPEQADAEIARFQNAVKAAKEKLMPLAETSAIFAAHLELLGDFTLQEGVAEQIRDGHLNAEAALEDTAGTYIAMFENMDNDYMRERAADLRDIKSRLMLSLKGLDDTAIASIHQKVIVVANDLMPSDTASMNLDYVLGFITEEGGVTGHVAIMARSMDLPAIVGMRGILKNVKSGDDLILDAVDGSVTIAPDAETTRAFLEKKEAFVAKRQAMRQMRDLPPETSDGKRVMLCANVGNLQDIKNALEHNIDGVGLLRSEFLYMENTHFPTEEEQFAAYREAAALLGSKELTIRTLDIGGDKSLPYYQFEHEENPFLGWRAIRICLSMEEMFRTQLRAILRSSAFGKVRVMFPMIISIEEFEAAKRLLHECMEQLSREGVPYDQNIAVGMMVETPASILLIDEFASRVDFFSIGTNDLTQYLLAVDRSNTKIAHLSTPFHPAVLRAINRTIVAGHAAGIPVGMCGEFASDARAQKLLLGMGLDEFSMTSSAVAESRCNIRGLSYAESKRTAANAICQRCVADVLALL